MTKQMSQECDKNERDKVGDVLHALRKQMLPYKHY